MSGYAPQAEKAFAQARACYEETEAWLAGQEAAALTHAELPSSYSWSMPGSYMP
jgi:hypothetical protein